MAEALDHEYLKAYHEAAKTMLAPHWHKAIHEAALPTSGGRAKAARSGAIPGGGFPIPGPNLSPDLLAGQPVYKAEDDEPEERDETKPAMVAHFPDPETVMKIHPGDVEGAQPPDNVHMTLIFCGDLTQDEFDELNDAVSEFAENEQAIPAKIGGVGQFFPQDERSVVAKAEIEIAKAYNPSQQRAPNGRFGSGGGVPGGGGIGSATPGASEIQQLIDMAEQSAGVAPSSGAGHSHAHAHKGKAAHTHAHAAKGHHAAAHAKAHKAAKVKAPLTNGPRTKKNLTSLVQQIKAGTLAPEVVADPASPYFAAAMKMGLVSYDPSAPAGRQIMLKSEAAPGAIDDGKSVVHATVDAPGLSAMQERLLQHLTSKGIPAATNHGFVPHISLQQVSPGDPSDVWDNLEPHEFSVDSLTAARGRERHTYPMQTAPDQTDVQKGELDGEGEGNDPQDIPRSPALSYELEVPIAKADDELRIVTGIVMVPGIVDSQSDVATATEIEKAAYRFMEDYREMGVLHQGDTVPDLTIVESYCAPVDMVLPTFDGTDLPVPKGTWLMSAHVNDEELWAATKPGPNGEPPLLGSFSVLGSALSKAV